MADGRPTSRISGFYKLSVAERLEKVREISGVSETDLAVLKGADPQLLARADKMIENVAGVFHLPVGFAVNFRIDGKDRLVPMVIEEPSVVAAASNAARLLRSGDGIVTEATEPLMIGQIQLCSVPDVERAKAALTGAAPRLVEMANEGQPRLVERGGGARRVAVRTFPDTPIGPMIVVHLLVDVCDAMGANLVNSMVEALAAECERLTGAQACLRILSNLADERLVHATGRVPFDLLARADLGFSGEDVARSIERASIFAEIDPYRAATHNKGIMNGVDAFLIATGQDWRAVEAGAHAFAARTGRYGALATWRVEGEALVGRATFPMQVGLVGGVTKVHPVVKVLLEVLGAKSAADLGRVAAAVGLAQNLAAIAALATEGIQRGHMSLHARNIAAAVGAGGDEIDEVVAEMIRRRTITHAAAESIYRERRARSGPPSTPAPAKTAAAEPITLAEIRALNDRWWPEIESFLATVIARGCPAGSLEDLLWYQLKTGGKRLRAVIPVAAYQALGRDPAQVLPFAAAMEMLHNATLIHSDAEDRVRTRRGHDTLWARAGLDQAVNCGDGLTYYALASLQRLEQPQAVVQWLSTLLVRRMLSVVRAEIVMRAGPHSPAAMVELIRERSGGLFSLAIAGAALLAGADEPTVARLDAAGGHLGVAFQVHDDLLDLVGSRFGVRRGLKIAEGRATLLTTHALSTAPDPDRAELAAILEKPAGDTTPADVARAIQLLESHGALRHAIELVERHEAALAAISRELEVPGIVRLISGITDIFFAPLAARLDR